MSWLSDLLHAGGTGGLNWHWHARASRQRWQPTSSALADFLRTVPVDGQHLLVLGASAGWMMPTEWLLRCARVDTVDIDPLAPHLFGWRHGRALTRAGVRWHHHRLDALAHLDDLLQRFPEAWLWFDNLLGQHRYRLRDAARAERELQALAPRLSGRHWGSVHDVYSGASPLTGVHLPMDKLRATQLARIGLGRRLRPSAVAAPERARRVERPRHARCVASGHAVLAHALGISPRPLALVAGRLGLALKAARLRGCAG